MVRSTETGYYRAVDATLVKTAKRNGSGDRPATTPTPHLFLIIEGRRPMAMSVRYSLGQVDEVILGRGPSRSVERSDGRDGRKLFIHVPDPWMSSSHARIERRASLCTFTDTRSTNGSMVNGEPTTSLILRDGDIIELGQTFFLFRAALPIMAGEPEHLDSSTIQASIGLVSLLPWLSEEFANLGRVVKTATPIVLSGQSGTGKEVIARAAHALSGRSGAFVAVNCGGLPDTLVESEFFGHKKGAFSGATEDRQGLVMAAHRGTLFLDEIGDLPLASQAALLRVLQEREVTPVGSTTPVPVDFRLISATHRNLESLVKDGAFREDLLARLSGFVLELPPLAMRKEDLGVLTGALLRDLCQDRAGDVSLSNDAIRALLSYDWPRNIRELRTCLQTALALADKQAITLAHLSPQVRTGKDEASREPGQARASSPPILSEEQAARRQMLIDLLREHQGNVSAVARSLGKVRSQVQRWLKRYDLDPESFRE